MLRACLGFVLAVSMQTAALAEDWLSWRGPQQNGTAAGEDYPVTWSAGDVQWKVSLPGPGASTPIVVNDQIFLTANDEGQNALLCYGLDGEERWRRHVNQVVEAKHRKATPCNSSPASDGKHVIAYFKSGDLACFTLDGELVWQKNLQDAYGENTLWWDLGTSPLLVDGMVIVTCQQTGPSYVVALDLETGEERWKQSRQLPAPEEANQSYTTPVVLTVNGQRQLVVVGADHITGHALEDGHEIWRVGDLNPEQNIYFRSIASPVVADDLVIAPYARGTTLTAVRPDGEGDVTDSHVAWQIEDASADVPTPAFHQGRLYVCGDEGDVYCLDAQTGEAHWSQRLPKSRAAFSSSPVLADGRLYLVREDATTFVLDAATGELLATNELEGLAVATPVFVNGQVILRTADKLFLIGT